VLTSGTWIRPPSYIRAYWKWYLWVPVLGNPLEKLRDRSSHEAHLFIILWREEITSLLLLCDPHISFLSYGTSIHNLLLLGFWTHPYTLGDSPQPDAFHIWIFLWSLTSFLDSWSQSLFAERGAVERDRVWQTDPFQLEQPLYTDRPFFWPSRT